MLAILEVINAGTLRIMGSQVTSGLEIPEHCKNTPKPPFFGGSSGS